MGQVKHKTVDPIPKLQADLAKVKKQLSGKSPVVLLADSVTTNAVAAGAITTAGIAAGAVLAGNIGANTITAGQIAASTITTTEIAANTITASDIQAATITTTEIAAGTITATNIAAGTITATQIAAGTITASVIAAGTITSTQIQAGSINSDRLYAGAVQAQRIQTNNLAAHVITANEISANTITANELAANSVTTVVLDADSVTSAKIAANTIVAADIASNTITAAQIAANTITASQIAAGTITATEIASATITSANIAAGTITATNIAAGTITSTLLASNSVTSAAIVSGAVTSGKISVSQLSAIAADLGTITAGTVTGATLRTASSGKRVVLDSTGITGYGGTGSTVVFNFDTTTGNLALTGTVQSGSTVPTSTLTGTLTTTQIGTGNVTSTNILDATIVGADVAANTITANNIVAATITATELATDSVTAVKILAGTITAGKIASGTITATQIAAGTITADRMNVTQLSAIAADLGTITAGTITGGTFRTASSGDRMEMAGTGATGYVKAVVSGVDVVKLDATSGLVFAPGTGAVNSIAWKSGASTYVKAWSEQLASSNYLHLDLPNAAGATATLGGELNIRAGTANNVLPAATLTSRSPAANSRSAYVSLSGGHNTTAAGAGLASTDSSGTITTIRTTDGVVDCTNTSKTTTLLDANGDMTIARWLHHTPPACRVYNSIGLTIGSGAFATVSFDSEHFDTDNMHTTSGSTGRITFNTAGIYVVGFHGEFASSAAGTDRLCHILKNGATRIAQGGWSGVSQNQAGAVRLWCMTVYRFIATDYIEAQVHQDSGGNLTLQTDGEGSIEFFACRIGV